MAYPSNNSDSVAQDQIKAFVDRILRMKGEVKALNMDIREIYAEAKGNGFDKTVLGKLVAYVEKRETDAAAVMEGEAIFELYLTAYDGRVGTVRATHTHASEDADEESPPQPLNQAGRTDAAQASARTSPVESEAVEISTPTTEPQPTKAAGSDLTASPADDDGQVADNPVAKAADDANSGDAMSEVSAAADAPEQADAASRVAGDRAPAATSEDMDATAGETASKYPAPGVIIWESTPPEGVDRHDYSYAFGDIGQDIEVIKGDMDAARAEPIVKIGRSILDGWARYTHARGQIDPKGQTMEYSVVQYHGEDPLMDCIRWNLAGRILNDAQRRLVSQRLSKVEPKRKREIFAAFELGMELVA